MPVLILMRHANAEPASNHLRDFDRPLSELGRQETKAAALRFLSTGLTITQIFCSPARRTEETLSEFRNIVALESAALSFHPELFSGDVAQYAWFLSALKHDDCALIVGHNPMIERFALHLGQNGEKALLNQLKFGFPTAAIAMFQFDAEFDPTDPKGKILHVLSGRQ